MSKSREKLIEILRIINEYDKPVGARIVSNELKSRGYDLGERTIRYHMQILDEKGYTQKIGYSGRKLTSLGKSELKNGLIYDHVDFVFSQFEEMIYKTNLDEKKKDGTVVVNLSKINLDDDSIQTKKDNPIELMKKVFNSGLAVSPLINVEKMTQKDSEKMSLKNSEKRNLKNSEKMNSEKNEFIIKTISETTIDGILLKHGIPSLPIYGGLIKIKDYVPQRFTDLITYKKTSIPPINAFVEDDTTSVLSVLENGNGIVPGDFRVIPETSLEKVKKIFNNLSNIGINGIISIGKSGEKVLGINVNESFSGIAIIGGITPLCVLKEIGCDVNLKLADELIDYGQLKPIHQSITYNGNINQDENNKDKIYTDTSFKKNILKNSAKGKDLKVSFLLSKAWNIIQNVDFDIRTLGGNLIADISYVNEEDLRKSFNAMKKSYNLNRKYISPFYKIVESEKGSIYEKENKIGIATICSLSFDGILINKGIMSTPKYGGLLEIGESSYFTELISYDGSSLDPHKIFISKNMTSITKNDNNYRVVSGNNGDDVENEYKLNYGNNMKNSDIESKKILASIKEVPLIAREKTKEILNDLNKIDLPIFKIGKPRELIYNAKVERYNFGYVTGSGLNPIAAIKESGIEIDVKAIQRTITLDDMDLL